MLKQQVAKCSEDSAPSTLDGNIEKHKRNLDSKVASVEMRGSKKIPVVNADPATTTNKNTFNSNFAAQTIEQNYAQLHVLCMPLVSTTKTFLSKQDTPHQTMVPKIDFIKIPKGKNTIMIAKALNKSKLSKEEYTGLRLAGLGYPGLNMLNRMQLNIRVQNAKKLK